MPLDYGQYDLDPMEGDLPPAPPEEQVQPDMDMTVDDVSLPSYPRQMPAPLPPPMPFPRNVPPLIDLLRNRGGR